MAYLIGTDEAGYGPNLGPLVISATVWSIPDDDPEADLYRLLRKVVSSRVGRTAQAMRRVAMCDSKVLYQSGSGLKMLERGTLAALALLGQEVCDWHKLWEVLCPDRCDARDEVPWHDGFELELPLEADVDDLRRAVERLSKGCDQAGVRLCAVRSRAVFPARFNALTEGLGNKAELLSRLTIELICEVLGELDGGPVFVICDKHGGRNRYGALLQQCFTDWLVEVHHESREDSVYRWGPDDRRVEVRFRPRAERFLPAALASMASKYLREVSMRAFNEYWRARIPELRPTAGYFRDARRFKAEIAEAQMALGIDDRLVWRVR